MNYWQIAAGASGHDYSKDFIRFGMAFVGGDAQVAALARMKLGDRVLLKRGLSELVAAGEVVERDGIHKGVDDKEWLRDFDGWDLRAYCFVDWHVPKTSRRVKGLTRGTIQKTHKKLLKALADKVIAEVSARTKLDPEPKPVKTVEDRDILEFLIRQGLRPGAAEDLTHTFSRIRLLADYYVNDCKREEVREHETRTFLIIPLLLALGWAEQQIKIEFPVSGKRADVACFTGPFRGKDEECTLLIESKGLSQGLDYAPAQAKAYAAHLKNCRVVLVSNGYCYKAYKRRKGGQFPAQPSAYLNLLKPRDRYPLDPHTVDGCLEVLRLLLPITHR